MHNIFKPTLLKDELYELPVKTFTGEINIVDSFQSFNHAIDILQNDSIWGFDTETKPAFKKGYPNKIALLQLANSHHAFLIRINRIGIPEKLVRFMENDKILKIGLAVNDDLGLLRKHTHILPNAIIDLQTVLSGFGISDKSLRSITGIVLKIRISKSQQLSNWENEVLTTAQQTYAATDAWVCHEIFQVFKSINPKFYEPYIKNFFEKRKRTIG